MHVILSFFYINHVCSPDGGNKDIYKDIYIYNLFKYSSALGIAFPLFECYHILLLQTPAAEEYENQ